MMFVVVSNLFVVTEPAGGAITHMESSIWGNRSYAVLPQVTDIGRSFAARIGFMLNWAGYVSENA